MKILLVLSTLLASFAFASEPTDKLENNKCILKGTMTGRGVIFLVRKKETHIVTTFEDCLVKAKDLLNWSQEVVMNDCGMSGPCYDELVKITVKDVKYKFKDGDFKYNGHISKK